MHLSPDQGLILLNLARSTIRRALGAQPPPDPATPLSTLAHAAALDLHDGLVAPMPDGHLDALPSLSPDSPPDLDPMLLQPAGCFVTLHESTTHRLRGCIGRLDTAQPLLPTVEHMAQAVLEDPRFVDHPVAPEELPHLELEITVIFPLRPAAHALDFEPLDDGIYLTIDGWSGCFLPQVARETGWTKEQLLSRLCTEKMGLPADAWQGPGAKLHVFSTYVIGPEPFEPHASLLNRV